MLIDCKKNILYAVMLLLFLKGCAPDSDRISANAMISAIEEKIKEYQLITGRLPTELEGLKALVVRPDSLAKSIEWKQIYLEVPLDPWGNEIQYLRVDKLKDGFGLYSCGPDGVSESGGNDYDDINSWSKATGKGKGVSSIR